MDENEDVLENFEKYIAKRKKPKDEPLHYNFHPENLIYKILSEDGDMLKFWENPVWVGMERYKKRKRITSIGVINKGFYSQIKNIIFSKISIPENFCLKESKGILGSFVFKFKGIDFNVSVEIKHSVKGYEFFMLKMKPATK